jgi:selenocysteine lyase/cysteine desulfurase
MTGVPVETPLVRRIRESVIGDDHQLNGPFGPRRVTYADHTASGRSLTFIEEYLRREVLPWYANTHTESSGTGRQTTRLREEARQIIRDAVGGDEDTAVIFTGSGVTGAVDKFMRILGVHIPSEVDKRLGLSATIPERERPVVFVGPYEHHSNELLWRESVADVVRIPATADGRVDTLTLERELARYAGRPLRIGSFSAASNVTGVLTDVDSVCEVLHTYGAIACWDYATAGPHLAINMCGSPGRPQSYRDAVFLSPHKFVGGPGTPGVLVVRREHVRNAVPTVPGGGTITYVHGDDQFYLADPSHREEGGTPAIVESIRAGLAFQLKQSVGVDVIADREASFTRRAIGSWRENPAISLLGNVDAERLPVIAFVVRTPRGRLHHNFVVAVLSDLFGIQCRGGCSCAGPYGHDLLGIDVERARDFAARAVDGYLGIKPGWTRVSFSFYLSEAAFSYIIEAVHLVATYGERLLPEYTFDLESGLWSHRDIAAPLASLSRLWYGEDGTLRGGVNHERVGEDVLESYLEHGRKILESRPEVDEVPDAVLNEACERLRWFELPLS